MSLSLKREFELAMVMIYTRALKECKYPANRFLQMIDKQGGVETAKALLAKPGVSDGFRALWECGRPDLSMEWLVLQANYAPLFTPEERQIASERLRALQVKAGE